MYRTPAARALLRTSYGPCPAAGTCLTLSSRPASRASATASTSAAKQYAARLHTSASTFKHAAKEPAPEPHPSAMHNQGAQIQSQTPAMDMMTGEMRRRDDIDPSLLKITNHDQPKPIPPSSQLQFGHTFTDHMLLIPWSHSTGWGEPEIKPYGPLQLDPSCTVLHYASTLFEGLKAYRDDKSGKVTLFRPDKNMERMNRSASRLAFPSFSGENVITLIKKLVSLDRHWIPSEPGHSLYIRPTMIGTQAALGVGASSDVLLFVICSPVGPYYKTGFKPVSLLATTKDVRAWPGGTGGYKLGANYAGGIVPQMAAAVEGYQQILWLFGEDHYVTEVGTMNLFIVVSDTHGNWELITPPLEDTILPGVTRDSILALAREHADPKSSMKIEGIPENIKVSERKLTMKQIEHLQKQGRLVEMFGAGTAAIVSPIKDIGYEGRRIDVPVGKDGLGDVARAMLREIQGRQLGTIESDWTVVVD